MTGTKNILLFADGVAEEEAAPTSTTEATFQVPQGIDLALPDGSTLVFTQPS